MATCSSRGGVTLGGHSIGEVRTLNTVILGHVAVIVYGCLLLCNSLFHEVLKRSGAFEKLKKFFKIR
jgi:hypothetical protein